MQVDFYFDFSSPNAYLAHKLVPAMEQRTGVEITYQPALLGGIFNATNNKSPMETNAHVSNKIKYDQLEFDRFVKKSGATKFRFNPHFQLRTVFMMRAAIAEMHKGNLRAYVDAGMKIAWEDEVNVNDPATTAAALSAAGFDGAALWEASQTEAIKTELFERTNTAVERGAFGMPTFFVGDEMFFGKDRMDQVEEEITKQSG
ncbi:2-hydroxychromene-2-carboxylate isomerase [Planktotalea sp.]|uniref:2-hydroxychromene-2-carboxylate isomerase n=1 Tax=Planktotalea sp. TaxID=2029877 RepID=UPI003298B9FD